MTIIGQRIKELRNELDITQNKLADVLGVTQDSISLWENGKRVPDTQYIIVLAKFFNVTSDYILSLSDDFSGVKFGHEGKVQEWLNCDEQRVLSEYREKKVKMQAKMLK